TWRRSCGSGRRRRGKHLVVHPVGLAPGEREDRLAGRVNIAEQDIGDGFGAAKAREPGFQDGGHLVRPRHVHRAAGFQHDDGVRVRRHDGIHQLVLVVGEREVEVATFGRRLVDENDGHFRGLGESGRLGGVGSAIELNLGAGDLGLDDLERGGGIPDGPAAAHPHAATLLAGGAGGGGTALPPGGSTCAEPPPERTPTSAWDPITATDFTTALRSGNWALPFLRSTVPRSATRCATSRPPNTSTTLRCVRRSNWPVANWARRMRFTMSSSRAMGTSPFSTACFRASPKKPLPGCSISRPASAALAVLCVPPQSERTNPLKPTDFFRKSLSR